MEGTRSARLNKQRHFPRPPCPVDPAALWPRDQETRSGLSGTGGQVSPPMAGTREDGMEPARGERIDRAAPMTATTPTTARPPITMRLIMLTL